MQWDCYGEDGNALDLYLRDDENKKVCIGCRNPIDVKFSDYASEDEQKRERARCMVKFWAHLAKMGYDVE